MSDYYAILQVAPTATPAEIRQAYAKAARERHPDRFQDPVEKERAQEFFKELSEAYNTLSNERARREYDANRNQPTKRTPEETAALAFERGQQALEARQYHDAVELLRTAVHHAPAEARYQATLARALSKNPHWVRDAIKVLEGALQIDPRNGLYHAELAALFAASGLKLRARREAEAARRLAPGQAAVEHVLQPLALEDDPPPDPPEGGAGGLRGLLRRKP